MRDHKAALRLGALWIPAADERADVSDAEAISLRRDLDPRNRWMSPERALIHVEDDPRHFRGHECIVWQLVKNLKNFEDMGHVEPLRTTKAVV
jgi:hypothetical protein